MLYRLFDGETRLTLTNDESRAYATNVYMTMGEDFRVTGLRPRLSFSANGPDGIRYACVFEPSRYDESAYYAIGEDEDDDATKHGEPHYRLYVIALTRSARSRVFEFATNLPRFVRDATHCHDSRFCSIEVARDELQPSRKASVSQHYRLSCASNPIRYLNWNDGRAFVLHLRRTFPREIATSRPWIVTSVQRDFSHDYFVPSSWRLAEDILLREIYVISMSAYDRYHDNNINDETNRELRNVISKVYPDRIEFHRYSRNGDNATVVETVYRAVVDDDSSWPNIRVILRVLWPREYMFVRDARDQKTHFTYIVRAKRHNGEKTFVVAREVSLTPYDIFVVPTIDSVDFAYAVKRAAVAVERAEIACEETTLEFARNVFIAALRKVPAFTVSESSQMDFSLILRHLPNWNSIGVHFVPGAPPLLLDRL